MIQQHDISALPATSATHMRVWFHAAAAQVAAYLEAAGGAEVLGQFPFLAAYLDEIRPFCPGESAAELAAGWLRALGSWERALPAAADGWPLWRLRQRGLAPPHILAILLAGLVEEDARFGALYATLHPLPDEQHLTVGLLGDLLRATTPEHASGWGIARELLGHGLLLASAPDRPRASWALRVPASVWDACGGERSAEPAPGVRYYAPETFPPLDELSEALWGEAGAQLRRVPALLRIERLPDHAPDLSFDEPLDGVGFGGLILRGMHGSGRLQALGSVARALGRGVCAAECSEVAKLPDLALKLGPLCLLYGALPVIALDLAPGDLANLPALPGYAGPIGVLLGQEGNVQGPQVARCITLSLPPPRLAVRAAHWSRTLGAAGQTELVEHVSRQHHLTGGAIRRAGRLALAYAALDGREQVQVADVRAACRALSRQSLDALATRIETGGAWDDLVVSEEARAELRNLVMRCRQRETVLDRLGPGFGRSMNRGVRALFSGVSGTGKTLAARILAAELGLDLYRVDLSSVVNKYIGETERNLSRVFARAEELDVVLLLDEGDSLLTGRTDVRSSNDRYANMETNYLLQRLESYEGILLVTTNAVDRIDRAFQRRIDIHVEFSAPDAALRYKIWQLHLAPGHRVGDALLRLAASRCSLSGGQIRNAALHATFLAVESDGPLNQMHLLEAIDREYRKLGATSPLDREAALL